jgi:hypothetical protein
MNLTKKHFLRFSIILFISFVTIGAQAQLNGTYTIGPNGNYASFSAAISALNSSGVSGAVVFNVSPGTYNEKLVIGGITGVSSTKTITFQSSNGDSTSVIISDSATSSGLNNYAVKFNNAEYIILKHLTLQRPGTGNWSQVIDISASSNNLKFENCRFIGQSTTASSIYKSIVYSQNNYTMSNIEFNSNNFINGSYGVWLLGQGQYFLDQGQVFIGNHFTGQSSSAIRLSYQKSPVMNNNVITNTSSGGSYKAIYCFYCDRDVRLLENKLIFAGGIGYYMHNSDGFGSQKVLMANNFISSSNGGTAIYLDNSLAYNIYYNNINITGANTGSSGLRLNGVAVNDLNIKNNSFTNFAGGYAAYVDTSIISTAITSWDYNNLYTSGTKIGFWKTNGAVDTLANWQTASGYDANSISVNPLYVSNTDLHVQNSQLDKAGTASLSTPSVAVDIDGEARGLTPDIGADQFFIDDLGLISIMVDSSFCKNESGVVTVYVKNFGPSVFNGNVPLEYNLQGNTPVSETASNINIASGDTIIYQFNTLQAFSMPGVFSIYAEVKLTEDTDRSNDTTSIIHAVNVHDYPVVDLGQDSTLCASHTITLNAGGGAAIYVWSTGQTDSIAIVDTTGLGIGNHMIYVTVANNGCYSYDSVEVTFVDCSGINEFTDTKDVKVYPVPAKEVCFVQSTQIIESIQLYAIDGTLIKVLENINTMNARIDLAHVEKGLYVLRIWSDKGSINRIIIKN